MKMNLEKIVPKEIHLVVDEVELEMILLALQAEIYNAYTSQTRIDIMWELINKLKEQEKHD